MWSKYQNCFYKWVSFSWVYLIVGNLVYNSFEILWCTWGAVVGCEPKFEMTSEILWVTSSQISVHILLLHPKCITESQKSYTLFSFAHSFDKLRSEWTNPIKSWPLFMNKKNQEILIFFFANNRIALEQILAKLKWWMRRSSTMWYGNSINANWCFKIDKDRRKCYILNFGFSFHLLYHIFKQTSLPFT